MSAVWLDDNELLRISGLVPSTPIDWSKRFPTLLSSDTYRGYATVLSKVLEKMRTGIGLYQVEKIIEAVDDSYIKDPRIARAGSDISGGAGLAVSNCWSSAHSGFPIDQLAAAFESELIYAAKMFVTALQRENRGQGLP